MPILTIRLPAELHERFLAECEKREIKPSEFGRRAIEAFVDHWMDERPVNDPSRQMQVPVKLPPSTAQAQASPPGIRGFTRDGEPIRTTRASRLKDGKKS